MEKILFHKDITEDLTGITEESLGRKGQSLAVLTKFKLPVPAFFIIETSLFKDFMSGISKNAKVETLSELRKAIVSTPFTREYLQLITEYYAKLSGFGKAWVSVRGSISAPKHPTVAFSGQLETFLNIRDITEIEIAIKQIYASLFNENVYEYMKQNGVSYSEISVGIIVQRMIQSEVSGIMYTFDPITLNRNNVSIEAVFGLGDVLNDGTINPDMYVVSKATSEVVEKKIVPQEWMKVRRIGDMSSLEHVQKIKISKVWQYSQKIDEPLIKELSQIAQRIETIIDPFQIVEWTMEGGSLWILQLKAVSPKLMVQETQHPREVEVAEKTTAKSTPKEKAAEQQEASETLLFLGNPASPGTSFGKALVISAETLKQDEVLESLLSQANKDTILVTDEFSHKLEPFFYKINGIITNYGGINSDAAITARELNLPAIVGTRIATAFIQNGTLLKIDGTSGTVYKITNIPEQNKEEKSEEVGAFELSSSHKISMRRSTVVEKQPLAADTGVTKIFIPKSLGVSSYLFMDEGTKFESTTDYHGVAIYVKDINALLAKRIKKIKNHISGSAFVILEDNSSVESLMEKKRKLSAYNVRRSRKVKIIVEVGSFFTLLNLDKYIAANIDGFVLNIEKLSANYGSSGKSFDANLFNLIDTHIQKIKRMDLEIIGATLSSNSVQLPIQEDLVALAKAGCNALTITKGDTQLSESTIRDFSSAYQNAVFSK